MDKIKENFYYCPQCNSQLPTLQCPKCQFQIHTELDKFSTLKEEKTIEEILTGFRLKCPDCMWNKEQETCQNCKDCLSEASLAIRQLIKKELEKRLPKEKQRQYVSPFEEKQHLKDIGYNQALTDCKTAIAEYLGEGR